MRKQPELPLDPAAIYKSPLGHRCTWVPLFGHPSTEQPRLFFRYVDHALDRPAGDGFCLSWRNLRIMKLVSANHAPAR